MDRPVVLVFAGLDPTGGAGLAADLRALHRAGAHGCPLVTALTAQDTHNATAVQSVDAGFLREQLGVLLADVEPAAIKTGLVPDPAIAEIVRETCLARPGVPLVVDPVLAAGGGTALAAEGMAAVLRTLLLPLATIATPNQQELQALCAGEEAAAGLLATGCQWLLVTGADNAGDPIRHVLYGPEEFRQDYRCPRLPGAFHGSGCTLAAALAARLAHGDPIPRAVDAALVQTGEQLAERHAIGSGQWMPG